jgi:hypothetical protein
MLTQLIKRPEAAADDLSGDAHSLFWISAT